MQEIIFFTTKEEIIKYIINNNLTISQTKKLIEENKQNEDISNLQVKDMLSYNEEFILDYHKQNDNNSEIEGLILYCKRICEKYLTLKIIDFNLGYSLNNRITFKNILSYYIKFVKYETK